MAVNVTAADEQKQIRAWLQYHGFNPDDPRQRIEPASNNKRGVVLELDNHPRYRGWIIPHPRFPFGFKHFLDPHQQVTRLVSLRVPWVPGLALPFVFEQRALHAWGGPGNKADVNSGDDTGQVLWRAAEVLSDFVLLKYAAPVQCHDDGPTFKTSASGASKFLMSTTGSRFRPRRVVELGCGACPLPSLAAGLCGHTVVGTDLPAQLILAQRNVDSNAAAIVALQLPLPPPIINCGDIIGATNASTADATPHSHAQRSGGEAESEAARGGSVNSAASSVPSTESSQLEAVNVSLAPLPWGMPLPANAWWAQPASVDLILCSDILYALPGQPVFFKELATTLTLLFRDALPHAVAVFTYQHRSGVEQAFFDTVLPAAGFACKDVTDEAAAAGAGTRAASPGEVVGGTSAGLLMQGMIRVIEVRPVIV